MVYVMSFFFVLQIFSQSIFSPINLIRFFANCPVQTAEGVQLGFKSEEDLTLFDEFMPLFEI